MRDIFQRRGRSANEPGSPRLTLGAFGKHPGWDDHILGIGGETETLVQVKETLYVGGIGAQVDSGAWEKLSPDRRLTGFDHTFLWVLPGHVLLGQLWSSTDGKGRSKYPMVLCIDGEGVSPAFMLDALLGGLERLRAACKATTSAEQVAHDCRVGQEQLRGMLAQDPSKALHAGPAPNDRLRFLEHPRLGPDRLGFLRALHELKAAPAMAAGGRVPGGGNVHSSRSSHLRLPLGADAAKDALLLWSSLLDCILPEGVPVFLIARAGEDWLDLLINEPTPDDFFFLQTSPKAVPLATDIPYQLAPDLQPRWHEIEAKFLGAQTPVASPAPAPTSPPPPSPPPISPPPAPSVPPPPKKPSAPPPAPRAPEPVTEPRRSRAPILAIGALVLVLALVAAWFFLRPPASTRVPSTEASGPTSNTQVPVVATQTRHAQVPSPYEPALAAARTAQQNKDFSNAIAQAELALKAKPGDPVATTLLDEVRQAAAALAQSEQKYQGATNAAGLALLQMNYSEATNQAGLALAIKPADPTASKLMADAQQAIATAAQQQAYQTAIDRAKAALAAAKYQEAVDQAGVALGLKPDDPSAKKLQADARDALAASAMAVQRLQIYQAATNAAGTALIQTNYQEAINQAVIALNVRSNDPVALSLKTQAEDALALSKAQAYFMQGDYAKASELCQAHAGNDSFNSLASSIAAEQKALADATSSLSNGDYTLIDRLQNQPYSAKSPFTNLVAQAVQEKASLLALQSLKQTNGWQELKQRLADPSLAALMTKPPFAELRTWADSQAAAPPETKEQVLQRLDTQLEVLLVKFGVFKPTAREIQTEKARQTKPLPFGALDTSPYLTQVQQLEDAYKQGGWLDQSNRRKYLAKITEAINNR